MTGGLGEHVPRRWLRWLVALAVIALATWTLGALARVGVPLVQRVLDVVQPVVIAFAIAYVLDPLVGWLQSRGRSRAFATWIVGTTVLLSVLACAFLLVPVMVEEMLRSWPLLQERFHELAEGLAQRLGRPWVEALDRLERWLATKVANPDLDTVGEEAEALLVSGKVAFRLALDIVLVPILAAYLLKDFGELRKWAAGLVPPHRRDGLLGPMREIDGVLKGFVRGQLKVAAFLTVAYGVGLVATQTPFALPLAVVGGLLSIVPYLGIAVTLVPAVVLNLLAHGDAARAAAVVATFVVAQLIEGNLVTPRVMSRTVGLHPALVLASLLLGGSFFGVTGLVLAVPVAATIMVLGRHARARWQTSDYYVEGAGPPRNRRATDPP